MKIGSIFGVQIIHWDEISMKMGGLTGCKQPLVGSNN